MEFPFSQSREALKIPAWQKKPANFMMSRGTVVGTAAKSKSLAGETNDYIFESHASQLATAHKTYPISLVLPLD